MVKLEAPSKQAELHNQPAIDVTECLPGSELFN